MRASIGPKHGGSEGARQSRASPGWTPRGLCASLGGHRRKGRQAAREVVITAANERAYEGIVKRHSNGCGIRRGGACSCRPTWQAWVWSTRDKRKIRRTFPTLAAAKGWRSDALGALRRGTMRAPSPVTVRQAADAWLEGARGGTIRARGGDHYKPSVLRGYAAALEGRVMPEFGSRRLADLARLDLQDFADRLVGDGLDPSSVRNTLMPLRAICRRAISRGELMVNPTTGIELPAVRGRRERFASADEASQLIAAVPKVDRAVWATAFYAGLGRGELLALRWEDVDLANGTLRVERAWDAKEKAYIEPKSAAGKRTVPIAAALRDHLDEHKLASGRSSGLVFGDGSAPLVASSLWRRAHTAWKRQGLEPIGLHEARHSFASLMIAAGVNAKALSTYMGHSSITITLDRYGHLMPGNESEAAALLDAYLARFALAVRDDHSVVA